VQGGDTQLKRRGESRSNLLISYCGGRFGKKPPIRDKERNLFQDQGGMNQVERDKKKKFFRA